MKRSATWVAGIVASLLSVIVLFSLYMGTYFLRGIYASAAPDVSVRVFENHWEATLFKPAAKIEGVLRGLDVLTVGPAELID
jgi:hypothetical protein